MEAMSFQPIGLFHCVQDQPVDSPRQASLATESTGWVELSSFIPAECLEDVVGFDRLWLLYAFHQNSSWKPKVRPPRGANRKRGVFATRSPYRPNPVGLSCVRLHRVEARRLWVSEHDLLDQTPILDIKPYIVEADCFPKVKQGWLENLSSAKVELTKVCSDKLRWLEAQLGKPVRQIVRYQLSHDPTNGKIKRVKKQGSNYCFHYQTWRLPFALVDGHVKVLDVQSNYSPEQLAEGSDPYWDKPVHRDFLKQFL
jgi:tRNA-Thr(GGU) m(6)t(6)A37 methyltransferase TsaA